MKKSILYTAIYGFIALLFPPILTAILPTADASALNLLNILSYTLLFAAALLLFPQEFKNFQEECVSRPGQLIRRALLAFAAILLCSSLLLLLTSGQWMTDNQAAVNQFLTTSFPAIAVVVILGPIVEEIMFRHILIGNLSKKLPTGLVCLFSILLFALLHIHTFSLAGLLQMKQYLVIGTVLSVLYVRSNKNLAYPIAAHMLNNLCSTILVLLSVIK